MRIPQKKLIAVLIGASLAGAVHGADSQAVSVLMDQAKYWKDKGRGDLAAEAWQKVLLVDPNNGDALHGLGTLEAESGRTDSAQNYLNRLQKTNPGHPGVLRLAQSIQFLTVDKSGLDRARKLAQSGNYDEGATVYRNLFGGNAPGVGFAPEYYLTLAGTNKGWDESRRSLEQLTRENPESTSLALAYAQVQTYREETRRAGIRSLAQLSKRPEVAAPSMEAWGKALTWLDARQADGPLYREYLEARPNDNAVRQRLADIGKPGVGGAPANPAQVRRDRMLTQGFAALERGQLDVAEANFARILAERPNDYDANGGLGVVRFRQQRFAESQAFLEHAHRGRSKKWNDALFSAQYWNLIDEANSARAAKNNPMAKAALSRALQMDGSEPVGTTVLGDILVEEGDYVSGEKLYRQALGRQPDNRGALRGLYTALASQKRTDEALALAKQLPPDEVDKLGDLNALRVATLRDQARSLGAAGNLAGARTALNQALAIDARDPWARLEVARLDIAQGRVPEARNAAEVLRGPQAPAGNLHASAILFGELAEPNEALVTLERVQPAQRSSEMYGLQRRLWVSAQSDQLAKLTAAGRRSEALALANGIEGQATQDPELQLSIAYAYADAGDSARAIALSRSAINRIPGSNVDARLQYAGIMQKTRQDNEFAGVLQQVYQQPLSPRQRRNANDLRAGYALGQAYSLRDAGQIDRARELLTPMIAERPDDMRFQLAMARTYEAVGDREGALNGYQRVLERDPKNLDARVAAINAAIVTKDLNYARAGVDTALAQAPRNPSVLAAAGRLARAQGDMDTAAKFFKAALDADRTTGFEMRGSNTREEPNLYPIDGPISRASIGTAPGADIGDGGAGELMPLASKIVAQAPAIQLWSGPAAAAPAAAPATAITPWTPPAGTPVAQPAYQPAMQPMAPVQQPMVYGQAPSSAPVYNIYIVAPGAQPGQATQIVLPGVGGQAGPAITIGPTSIQSAPVAVAQPQYRPRPVAQPMAVAPRVVAPSTAYVTPVAPAQAQAAAPSVVRPQAPKRTVAAVPPIQRYPRSAGRVGPTATPLAQAPAAAIAAAPIAPSVVAAAPGIPSAQSVPSAPVAVAPFAPFTPFTPLAPAAPIAAAPVAPYAPPVILSQNQLGAEKLEAAAPSVYSPYIPAPAMVTPVADTPLFVPVQEPIARTQLAQATPIPSLAQRESTAVRRELAEIEARRGSTLTGGVNVRSRSGDSGRGELLEIEAPVEARVALGYDQHLVLRAAGVSVDAGTNNSADRGSQTRFGTNALGPVAATNPSQSDSGIAASIGYESPILKADVGTTPIGFRIRNTIGGVRLQLPADGAVRFLGELSRRPVTDSLLSYAGARDDRTGTDWGGVASTGGRAGVLFDDGNVGGYVQGMYHRITGENVKDNNRGGANAGIFVRLMNAPENALSVGADINYFKYDNNLRYFSLGQGGYFSPQQYVSLSVPVDWVGRSGRVSYQVRAAAGVQRFKEKDSDWFPNNGALQGALNTAALTDPGLVTKYTGITKTGGLYNLSGSIEYQAAPQLFVGGMAGFNNARDFQERIGGVYLRYAFSRETTRLYSPPGTLRFNTPQY